MDTEKLRVFEDAGFRFARMISGSKTGYLDRFPDHKVVFNSRVYDLQTYEKEKDRKIKDFFAGQEIEIWYGDLDLTRDTEKLKEIANKIGTFVVTRESGDYVTTIEKGE
jgi:hypothetical protein